jgi:6-phosphogluconate dehydrogenase
VNGQPVGPVGLIGLGTMGRALVEALARAGFAVHAADPLDPAPDAPDGVTVHAGIGELAAALQPPRRILTMVTAGDPVDAVIDALKPACATGDLLIDGGNSFFRDTVRREAALASDGIGFLGVGISGGEEGARNGASVMAGGTDEAFAAAEDVLTAIAAAHDGAPCCAHVGPGGAGHFVKMVHNGIEYALMQAIAEAHFLLHAGNGLSHDKVAAIFRDWNEGPLESYLLGIAAAVLETPDPDTGAPLLDRLDDRAGESGTGRWIVSEAMALGVPVPSIMEAVAARNISGQSEIRTALREEGCSGSVIAPDDVRAALTGCTVAAFAQGLSVIAAAAARDGWEPDFADIARIWRKGCIVQGAYLRDIEAAFARATGLPHLLMDKKISATVAEAVPGWRATASAALSAGLPAPVISASLGWYDSLRTGRLWTALVQAQRDYFGRHGLRRTDRDGVFHADWKKSL